MSEFKKENLENIKGIFEQRTGVSLPKRRRIRRPVKLALVLAAVLLCLSITAFAGMQFSVLEGDDLALNGVYEGEGIVAITVENRSDKLLEFEEKFYLNRWLGSSVAVDMEAVRFENTTFAPKSKGVMRIDLSDACDVSMLEQPLAAGDHYYFLLTNNGFAFGQDWMCGIDFAPRAEENTEVVLPDDLYTEPSSSEAGRKEVEESLRFYFENVSLDIVQRRQQAYEYIDAYTELLAEFEGEVIASVSPCLPGNRIDITKPLFSVAVPEGEWGIGSFHTWTSVDADYRLIATEEEDAYVVEAVIDTAGGQLSVPMLFILSYERERISDDAYAFIHGRLITFAELEQYKVFEDEGKVSYEVSALIYDDPAAYVRAIDEQDGDTDLDEAAAEEFVAMREYYLENLGELIYYRQPE